MNHASLFSGIGGFDLAASWMGWNNIFQVEKDEWCQGILAKHFPSTERYKDIKEFNGEKYRGSIDVVSGGFPCQPFSVAGKQKGKEDDRYLWPEMLRVIREIQPTWIVGENVPGIIPMALDQVLSDLENEGYSCQAFIIPACGVEAIHKRDRVWILAYNANARDENMCEWENEIHANDYATNTKHNGQSPSKITGSTRKTISQSQRRTNDSLDSEGTSSLSGPEGNVSNSTGEGLEGTTRTGEKTRMYGLAGEGKFKLQWPVSQPTICRGDDGVSYRLDDNTLISAKQRTNALKGLGNAVVPQVVYEIFRMIDKYE